MEKTRALFEVEKPEPKIKKQRKINPDKAPGLVKFFYNLTNTQSPNFAMECHNVKALLNKGYTPDQIRITMNYLYKRKQTTLGLLNRSIEDAILDDKYWNERTTVNTPAYFVKLFYNKTHSKFNRMNFLSNVRKIQTLLEQDYTYNDILNAIEYMTINHITIFNYISNIITQNNTNVQSELRYANIQVNYDNYNEAVEIYKNKSYLDKTLTMFEYAYLIRLPLNKELIKLGLLDKKNNDFKFNIQNVNYNKDDFLTWLQTQFTINQIVYNL